MTANCRSRSPVVQSTRMDASRLRRAGTLLLVLWLTGDVAAFGFCSGELLTATALATVISASDDAGGAPSCCTGHRCFCCSSGAEAVTCDLSVEGQTALIAPSPPPIAPEIPLSDTSPPPRL